MGKGFELFGTEIALERARAKERLSNNEGGERPRRLGRFSNLQATRKLIRQIVEVIVNLSRLCQPARTALHVLDESRDELERGLTLRTPKLVVIMYRRV